MFLRGGRLFHREESRAKAAMEPAAAPMRKIEFFWLCEECAPRMTVVLRDGVGIPKPREDAFIPA